MNTNTPKLETGVDPLTEDELKECEPAIRLALEMRNGCANFPPMSNGKCWRISSNTWPRPHQAGSQHQRRLGGTLSGPVCTSRMAGARNASR